MTLEKMQEIVTELQRRGIPATLEYPGYIETRSKHDDAITWADNEETFLGQVMTADYAECIETIESDIVSADVLRIANHIACYSKGESQ